MDLLMYRKDEEWEKFGNGKNGKKKTTLLLSSEEFRRDCGVYEISFLKTAYLREI